MKNNSVKWLCDILKNRIWQIIELVTLQVVFSAVAIFSTMAMRNAVNYLQAKNMALFKNSCIIFAVLFFVQILTRSVGRFVEEELRTETENRLKHTVLKNIFSTDYAAVKSIHSDDWLNRISTDTQIVADDVVNILPGIMGTFVRFVMALCALYYLWKPVLLVLVPSVLVLVIFDRLAKNKLKSMHNVIREKDGQFREFVSEHISHMDVVHTYLREERTLSHGDTLMKNHKSARIKRNTFLNFGRAGYSLAVNGTYLISFAFCGVGIINGNIAFGDFMAILQLVSYLQSPVSDVANIIPKYYEMLSSIDRLRIAEDFDSFSTDYIDSKSIYDFYNANFKGISLENINFSYPVLASEGLNQTALKDFNLTFNKGEILAFTGHSGCGKSTVIKLLSGMYHQDTGRYILKCNDKNVDFEPKYRSLFAYVPQGNGLMSGTIRDAVSFENTNPSDEKIWQALQIACADTFVQELDNGLDTQLNENGSGLSEGQLQRIAIARAIYHGSPILLLDEITSSLDSATEYKVLHNLKNMTDKTVLIVTHRPAVLDICDRVIDFEKYVGETR